MNLRDAASIAYPFRERDLDPPTAYWTDANERDYAAWLATRRAELEHEFAQTLDDAFDEFCHDIFDAEEMQP